MTKRADVGRQALAALIAEATTTDPPTVGEISTTDSAPLAIESELSAISMPENVAAQIAAAELVADGGEVEDGEKVDASVSPPLAPITRTGAGVSPELADEICSRLVALDDRGWPRSLRDVCSDEDMPSRSSVMRWLRSHPDFAERHDEARHQQGIALLDQLITLMSSVTDENWRVRRVQIDALFRLGERLLPILRRTNRVHMTGEKTVRIQFETVAVAPLA